MTDDNVDKLVVLAETHYARTLATDGPDDPETARRRDILRRAEAMRDAGIELRVSPTTAYLEMMHSPMCDFEPDAPHIVADGLDLPDPVDWEELRRDDSQETSWLLEPLLVAGRSHALYAPAKTGKSLLLLEAAVSLATGREFLHQPAGAPVNVVILDFEMTRGDLRDRMNNMDRLDDDLAHLAYYAIPLLAPLDTELGGRQVEAIAKRHHAALVIVDTTGRAVEGAENEADTVRALYRHTCARLKAAGIAVLRVDHAGKDVTKGQRGSSAKNDDVDIVWQLTAAGGDRLILRCTHQRVGFVPAQVDLVRQQEPVLTHRITTGQWPAGTSDLAERLESIGVPLDAGRDKVRRLVKTYNEANPDDQIEARNNTLSAAIKWRRVAPLRTVDDMIGAGTGQSDLARAA